VPRSHAATVVYVLVYGTLLAHAQLRCDSPRNPVFGKYERLDITDGWFEVYRLPGGVYALWEPRQSERVFSYLIIGEKRALLFDSGFGIGHIEEVVRKLTALPVMVLNSHTHYDHVGGNYAFANVLGINSDYTRNSARGFPNSKMAASLAPGQFCPPLPEGVTQENYVIRPFRVTQIVSDGETIDLGGRKLEVIATPGHTPDAICLLDRAQRELFTGDTFYPGSLWLWVPETDLNAYQRSVERIARLTDVIDVLRPAHNLPEADPKMLQRVSPALSEIRAGKITTFTVRNGRRTYQFEGFSIQLANPDGTDRSVR
jgi:glyoxylase-like metal-dependent hydrolase (beta-lactamase superfamily II)